MRIFKYFVSQINIFPFYTRKTAATGPLSIERALKTDLLTASLAAYQNILIPINNGPKQDGIVIFIFIDFFLRYPTGFVYLGAIYFIIRWSY